MKAIARTCALLLPAVLSALALAQGVAVRATVDRSNLRSNESFTYVLRAEGQVRGEPDMAVLEQQFEVLQSTTSTRIQIVNGRAEQIAEWIYQLMPRTVGSVRIPPIEVAGAFSNPVDLEILPPAPTASDVPEDIFLEVEAQPTAAYVQSQVVFTLRLYVGIATGRATITPPQVTGGEAIVERLGEDRQYRTTRGGRDFDVHERRYAIFPQEAGTLTIGPATFEAMVIPGRGFSRVQRFGSGKVELTVKPAVAPPAAYAGAAWLPASRLSLSERWSDEPSELTVGEPTTRAVMIEAEGLLETQLPELDVPQASGVRQYEDQPELDRTVTPDGLVSRRIERYAVLAQSPGETELPRVALPWFNVDAGRWEAAELAPRPVVVAPSPDAPAAAAAQAAPVAAAPQSAAAPERDMWPAVAAVLAAGWLVTLLLWWRSRVVVPANAASRSAPSPLPLRTANRRQLRELRAACARNDAETARRLLLEWAALRFVDSPPRTLGALAGRLPAALADEVRELEAELYGRDAGSWDGAGLAAVLGDMDSVKRAGDEGADSDALLPLYR